MPPAVMESESAIITMVRLAVFTRGSRMMDTPLETASMPVSDEPPLAKDFSSA